MRQGQVYVEENFAGTITETPDGFVFAYDRDYLTGTDSLPISLTMYLAETAHIDTVPLSLICFADGELNYTTRRIDRIDDGRKLPMEDFCQIAGLMTEQKYQGCYEYIASLIKKHSCVSGLDVTTFWEQVIFAWIVGNADMHMKNFSLICKERGRYQLSLTYD